MAYINMDEIFLHRLHELIEEIDSNVTAITAAQYTKQLFNLRQEYVKARAEKKARDFNHCQFYREFGDMIETMTERFPNTDILSLLDD